MASTISGRRWPALTHHRPPQSRHRGARLAVVDDRTVLAQLQHHHARRPGIADPVQRAFGVVVAGQVLHVVHARQEQVGMAQRLAQHGAGPALAEWKRAMISWASMTLASRGLRPPSISWRSAAMSSSERNDSNSK